MTSPCLSNTGGTETRSYIERRLGSSLVLDMILQLEGHTLKKETVKTSSAAIQNWNALEPREARASRPPAFSGRRSSAFVTVTAPVYSVFG
jgi:hypothetical protein